MSFRFLHAADIHLDSPLRGLSQSSEEEAQEILTASRQALENLIQYAVEQSVDFVVIAGDLYDGDWKDLQTGLFFVAQMGRLAAAEIPAYVLHGNHDAASRISRDLPLPDNVFRFSATKAETFTVDGHAISLHGQSFPTPDVTDNLVPGYPNPVAGHFNIGVLHTALEGSALHANYAPCSVAELKSHGYDYWALGHVHEHKVCAEDPYIVYPGNLQGRHIREPGAKGACLVSVDDDGSVEIEHIAFDVARWALVSIDVSDLTRFSDVIERMGDQVREAVAQESGGRLLACRIELVGTSEIHAELKARNDDLRESALAQTLHDGTDRSWIEKVKVRTTPPEDAATLAEQEDALGELFRVLPEAVDDEEFKDELTGILHDLRAALPHEVKDQADDELLRAALDDDLDTLIEGVRMELLSDLVRSGGKG
jgi:DNA repair exonuclease SbcCD nuclease subunit